MKYILLLSIYYVTIFASYNPFFQEVKSEPKKQVSKKVITNTIYKPRPSRKNIQMSYFGYIHTKKGKFALVNFQNQNIIIKSNDSLYIDEQIFKIKKVTSNYILLKDRYGRLQTVYFSSQTDKGGSL